MVALGMQAQAFTVTFRLQMTGVTGYTTPEVNGTFNGWCGTCNAMNDSNNDGIWETTIDLPAGYYEYKYSADNWSQQESLAVGSSCTATSGQFTNRTLQVTGNMVLPIMCWGLCTACTSFDVTFAVDMSVVSSFTTPYVSGTFNNWCGNCLAMSDPNNDGIWTATITLQSGYFEYKFSHDNWLGAENLPVGAPCTVTNFGFTNRFINVSQNTILSPVCWGSCDPPGTGNGPTPSVQIAITTGSNPSCILTDLTFTATTTNTTSTPAYQWYVDGIPVGLNQNTYSSHQLVQGQSVSCSITGGAGCGSSSVVNSNAIVVQRNNPATPSITISSSNGGNWCSGQEVTFNATAVNAGTNPSYQWKVNGNNVGTNSPTYTSSSLLSGQTIQCVLTSNSTCQHAPWNMIWNDEFNGTSLDLTKWTPQTGATGWGNNEWQNYTNSSNNIQFDDGQLHIVARNDGPQGLQYTSARLITKNLFSFKYGRVSGRLQIPTGQGIWPAFWMLGANIDQVSWPACGEIDIMEHINNEAVIYGTTHWSNNGWTHNSGSINTAVDGYHDYMVEWDSLKVKFFMDGQFYHEHIISSSNNSVDEFTKPFFLLLNVAVGGNWPGYPDGTTTFPVSMDVDYVRVWQRNNATNATTFNSNSITIAVGSTQTWYLDNDGDGYGLSSTSQTGCQQPQGYAPLAGDCNDNNNTIHPGATELCNGVDDNCSGFVDESFTDTDNDGIADCIDTDIDGDGTMNAQDCAPNNNTIWQSLTVYTDLDGDTYGTGAGTILCMGNTPPAGFALSNGDCDDTNASAYPGSTAAPATVSGPITLCGGNTYTFNTTSGAQNYVWQLPALCTGTSSSSEITIAFAPNFLGGQLCVTPQYSCASAPTSCTMLTPISGIAPYPGVVAGNVQVCADNSVYTYSIAPLNYVENYVWTVPNNCTLLSGQGTTNISVSYNESFVTGNLTIQTFNCTGGSLIRTVKINKQTVPGRPGQVSGSTVICPGTEATYSVSAATGATSHEWTASNGITILSGQGTTTVTVAFASNYVTGGLNVVGTNCTGVGQSRYRTINRVNLPSTPGLISGQSLGVCGQQTLTYNIAAMSNVTGYEWQPPANASIVSGQGTTNVTVSFNAGFSSGSLSVRAINCSGLSATPRVLNISNSLSIPTTLSGPTTAVCGGSTHTFTSSAVVGATQYVWTVPSGVIINGANNGLSINVTFPTPFASGTISVRASNACVTGLPKSITVQSTLSQPGNISGTTSGLCGGCTYTYSIPAIAGATNYNWSLPAGWTVLNNGNNSIDAVVPSAGFVTATISVTAQNACGNSPVRVLNVTGNLTSSTPYEEDSHEIELLELSAQPGIDVASDVLIYPNPTDGNVFISCSGSLVFEKTFFVSDANGKRLDIDITTDVSNQAVYQIDLSTLPSGMYVIHCYNGREYIRKRVIKE